MPARSKDWNVVMQAINDMDDFVLVLQKDTREQGWTGKLEAAREPRKNRGQRVV